MVYVDDIVITGDDYEGIKALKQHLFQNFQTKNLGPLRYFPGLKWLNQTLVLLSLRGSMPLIFWRKQVL